jgi:hypothetical protein
MLDPSLMVTGTNRIDVYAIESSELLRPLDSRG